MGSSLSGVKIKDTYQGLIKTTDNAAASSTSKQLTDGLGNDLGIEVNTSGELKATTLVKSGGTSSQILLADGTVATTLASSFLAADSVGNTQLADSSVKAAELSTSNTAVNAYILSYNSSTGGFTWVPQTSADGGLIVSNEGNNRVITSSGTGTGVAESNLTFDGATNALSVTGTVTSSGTLIAGGDGSTGGVTVADGQIDIRTSGSVPAQMKFYCEESNAHAQTLKAQPHSAASSAVLTLPSATGTLVGTGDTSSVTGTMLGTEFTASQALSSGTAVAVDTNTADVFTLTLGHSATLNFTNVAIGDFKTIIITGGGNSYGVTLGNITDTSSTTVLGTFNKISGTYSDTTDVKNLLQIKFISTTEAWYSYSQISS
tara:strand:- start:11866 stop:12990 length:1125 start_codon:yes stop_codon:yes gene_type:complete